jgi:hypothetical protein
MRDRTKLVKRALVAVLLLVGVGYAATCAYLWTQQRALIFLPESAVRRTPNDIGIDFRELNIAVNNRGVARFMVSEHGQKNEQNATCTPHRTSKLAR